MYDIEKQTYDVYKWTNKMATWTTNFLYKCGKRFILAGDEVVIGVMMKLKKKKREI